MDLSNICRACLKTLDGNMFSIFEIYENNLTLVSIIQTFLSVEIHEEDGNPHNLCADCVSTIITFYNFAITFEASASKLQKFLEDLTEVNCKMQDDDVFYFEEVEEIEKSEGNNDDSSQNLDINEVETIYINGQTNTENEYQKTDYWDNKFDNCDKQNYSNQRRSKSNILKQKNIVSVEQKTNLFKCSECGKTFRKKVYLKEHMDLHSKQKLYKCQFCGKSFTRRTVLVKHKRIHTHPKFYMCEMCGRSFNDKGTLTTHIKLLHIKERNFLCDICNLTFPLKATLEKHKRRHQKEDKKFECTQCNMKYYDNSSLKRHILMKHTNVDYKLPCNYCNKKYTTVTNLKMHVHKHHS